MMFLNRKSLGFHPRRLRPPQQPLVITPDPAPFDDLTLAATYASRSIFPSTFNTRLRSNVVLAGRAKFPSTNTRDEYLMEVGGSGTGFMITTANNWTTFRIRAGDGVYPIDTVDTAVLEIPIADLPFDDQEHGWVVDIRVNPGRVRLWMEDNGVWTFHGEGATSTGGRLENGRWSGGGTGGYPRNANISGETNNIWSADIIGDLSVYQNQQVSDEFT